MWCVPPNIFLMAATDHSAESCIHLAIETDIQPRVYGTVSLTEPVGEVDKYGMPF